MKKPINLDRKIINEWLEDTSSSGELEIEKTEDALIQYVSTHAIEPDANLRDKVINKIKSLNALKQNRQVINMDYLPVLTDSSNWLDWEEAVKDLKPPQDFESIHLHPLESTEQRDLFVAWVKEYIEEEVHTDILESFILLEGTCECHITDVEGNTRVVRMAPGDFITMQVGETHDVIITSLEPAKAILQWMKLSA